MKRVKLPYFDYLLAKLSLQDAVLTKSFGRHVHWGYWEKPGQALLTADEFARAAEELSRQLCVSSRVGNAMAVLDVGCGFGGTLAHINENYQSMTLVGLNLDGRQLTRAQELSRPAIGNKIEFCQGNACALPFPNECFDVVLAVECIFHFPSRAQFFQEAFRVLKPGGILALSDFVSHPLIKPFTYLRLPALLSEGFYGRCNFQFTFKDYQELARKIGFEQCLERDITKQTLPTYSYLRRLSLSHRPDNPFALLETAAAEGLSLTGLLKYTIFSYIKPH